MGVVGASGRLTRLKKTLDYPETRKRDVGLTTFDLEVYSALLELAARQNITYDPEKLKKSRPLTAWLTKSIPVGLFYRVIFPPKLTEKAKRRAILRAIGMLERAGAIRRFRGEIQAEGQFSQAPAWRFVFPGYRLNPA